MAAFWSPSLNPPVQESTNPGLFCTITGLGVNNQLAVAVCLWVQIENDYHIRIGTYRTTAYTDFDFYQTPRQTQDEYDENLADANTSGNPNILIFWAMEQEYIKKME